MSNIIVDAVFLRQSESIGKFAYVMQRTDGDVIQSYVDVAYDGYHSSNPINCDTLDWWSIYVFPTVVSSFQEIEN